MTTFSYNMKRTALGYFTQLRYGSWLVSYWPAMDQLDGTYRSGTSSSSALRPTCLLRVSLNYLALLPDTSEMRPDRPEPWPPGKRRPCGRHANRSLASRR